MAFTTFGIYQATGRAEPLKAFAEQCMAEYDLDGWTRPDLITSDDLEIVRRR